jgi:Protein of unknown function (DUF2833)
MNYSIVKAAYHHAAMVAASVRADDRAELAAVGQSPLMAAVTSLHSSTKAWTGIVDGEPICIFGVSEWADGSGRPWMIATDKLEPNQRIFLRKCKECVAAMLDGYNLLHNFVSADNTTAIKWLQWLGFEIGQLQPYGKNGETFYYFWKYSSQLERKRV